MKKLEIEKLAREIESISNHFEDELLIGSMKILRENFSVDTLGDPNGYLDFISEIGEILRQARVLFIYSAFNRVCEKEGVEYRFKAPYKSNMKYSAVMKKDGIFYILDEDGDYRDIFCTEKFAEFVENEYRELIEKGTYTDLIPIFRF